MLSIEGTSDVCAHMVKWSYWDIDLEEEPEDLRERLEDAAEERAKEMITEGYVQGELNCLYVRGQEDMEIRGWWKIE